MITNLLFSGVTLIVREILNPKSKFVEYLGAKVGDKFDIKCDIGMSRRYATYFIIINTSNNLQKVVTQTEFFNTIQRTFEFE